MAKKKQKETKEQTGAPETHHLDPAELGQALAHAYTQMQPFMQDLMSEYSKNIANWNPDPMNIGETYAHFISHVLAEPEKFIQIQQEYWEQWMNLWQESTRKFLGEKGKTVVEQPKGDRRFKDKAWQESALFDFIRQSYLLTCAWMDKTVHNTEGLDKEEKEKLAFYTRLFAEAMSPSNFLLTNPEVLKETLDTGGENLVRGLKNLTKDLKRGKGHLKISTTDYDAFELGKNIATTPGKVVYQNDLMQLIQYAPATDEVFEKPLLIVPPWINKFYILDLRPDNSLIKWAVENGHTVFTISWVNPTPKLAGKRFEDYMQEGIFEALEQIKKITGSPACNAVGYCLGGTLLATALAYLSEKKEANKIASATFLTTLIDFENSGEMKLFMDEEQLTNLERTMNETGVLQARELQRTFSLLRSNDLIWSFVVNNYLMGREPFPFDLLYWNDDSTNMPAAMHGFYLKNMYKDNLLTKPGGITMKDTPIDIRKIKTPAYILSTREDHIAPWKATYATTQMLSGPVTFTLAASGHIAGVVNSPERKKYCYWTAEKTPENPDTWIKNAQEHEGSWWPHWQKWIESFGGQKVPARKPGKGIEDAPGSYVRVKSD